MTDASSLITLSFALGLDSFRAGLALGTVERCPRRRLAIAAGFAASDALSTVVGYLAGRGMAEVVADRLRVIGPAVLAAYAVAVLITARRMEEREDRPLRGAVMAMPVALSLDNLVAGTAFGAMAVSPVASAATLGLASGLLAFVGLRGGGVIRRLSGELGEVVGAFALLILAAALVLGVN
jgi:putative Mn2+ efflux pump MntP